MIQQWEHTTVNNHNESEESILKRKGKDGWELAAVTCGNSPYAPTIFYFKRPIPHPSTAEKIFNDVKNEVEGGHMEVKTTS